MESLVSILIITFNSSKTIIETLESAKQQSYESIEIVVSDDCSNDDTVQKCRVWIEKNQSRFVNCKIVVAGENKGVSANCNQAILNATGEWAKLIAGDDIMMPDCIKDNIQYVKQNQDAFFVFSKMNIFTIKNGKMKIIGEHPTKFTHLDFFNKTSEEQHKFLCRDNFIPAPTLFCHLKTLKNNLYKEKYRFCEDYPQWFSLTGRGYRLFFFPNITVLYRMSDSLTNSHRHFVNSRFIATYKLFFYTEMSDYLRKNDIEAYGIQTKQIFLFDFAIHILNNKKNLFNQLVLKIFSLLYKE